LLAATADEASIVGRVVIVERDPRAYECRALFAEDDGPTLAVPVKIPDDARKLLRAMTSNEEATLPRAAIHPSRILTVEDD